MKRTYLSIILMLAVLASNAQSLQPLVGLWSPTIPSNSTLYTKIEFITIISDTQAKVSLGGNNHTIHSLKPISSGFETVLPIEVKQQYGYDAKRIVLRLYNKNNILRAERKIYEYDRAGNLVNSNATLDNVIYQQNFVKYISNKPNTSQKPSIAYVNTNAEKLKQMLKELNNSTNLSNFKSFNLNEFSVEVLNKGDNDDNNTDEHDGVAFKDMFEITGTIDYIQENGKLLNLYNNGNNHIKSWQPSYSTFLPVRKPFIINQTFVYDLNGKDFFISKLKYKVRINENDMTDKGGDKPGKVQLVTDKTFEVLLKDLKYGKNQIILYSKDGGSLALNFNIGGI